MVDRAGDPHSASNRILKALVDAGENGLTSAEAAAIINRSKPPSYTTESHMGK
jgi:hypothetical protein